MSWWTEVFLAASSLEDIGSSDAPDQYVAIDQINDWLRENGWWDLILIKSGERHCPHSCFVGSLKSLARKAFIEAVQAAPWQWREQVQLFLREEDDKGFIEIKLWTAP